MKVIFTIALIFSLRSAIAQTQIETAKLPHIPYKPKVAINGITQVKTLSIDSLLKYGLQVVLDDKTYKVIQFDIVYDCHSMFVMDFSVIRYSGDKVSSSDNYFRNRILVGDIIDVANTVIDQKGYQLVMNYATYTITK